MPRFMPNTGTTGLRRSSIAWSVCEHEAVAAQGDDHLGILDRHPFIGIGKLCRRGLRGRSRGGDERPAIVIGAISSAGHAHVPRYRRRGRRRYRNRGGRAWWPCARSSAYRARPGRPSRSARFQVDLIVMAEAGIERCPRS